MLKLKRLEGEAFSSFTEPFSISFEPNSLVLLSGRNGSGKSSLTEALAFPLGYNTYSSVDLQNWFTKKPLNVTEYFDSDEGEVILSKGKKTTLSINGEEYKGSAAQIDERMRSLLGGNIDTDTLSLLCYRQQKQPGLLLSLTDADKKEFLTKVIPLLRKFEEAIEESAEKGSALKAKLEAQKANVLSITNMMGPEPLSDTSGIEARIEANRKLQEAIAIEYNTGKDVIRLLEIGHQEAQNVVKGKCKVLIDLAKREAEAIRNPPVLEVDNTELNRLEELLDECKARALELTIADNKVLAELTRTKKELEAQKNQKKLTAARANLLRPTVLEIDNELKELAEQRCFTCQRPWDDTKDKIDELNYARLSLTTEIDYCDQAKLEAVQLENQIEAIEFTPNPEIREFESIKETIQKQYNEETNRINVLIATHASNHQVLYQKALNEVTRINNVMLEELASLLASHKIVLASHEVPQTELIKKSTGLQDEISNDTMELDRIRVRTEQYNKIKESLNQAKTEVSILQLKYNQELEFHTLLKEFMGAFFEEMLDQIADEANKTLASVANTAHCSIRFKPENETKKGTIQKKITPIISVGGKEANIVISKGRPRCSAVSGGMMATIELAVDLALGYVIEQRHGICAPHLVLDEAFEGLDSVSKDTSLEILQKYAQTKLVIVVDHTSEFTSMFNKVIEVEQIAGHSSIKKVQ